MRQTVTRNQQYIHPGANFMLLNGMLVEIKNFEIYSELSCVMAVVEQGWQGARRGQGVLLASGETAVALAWDVLALTVH